MEFLENDFEFAAKVDAAVTEEVLAVNSGYKDFFKRLLKNKGAVVGGICIIIIALFAMIAPIVSPFEFDIIDTSIQSTPPNSTHIFGTDVLGRDLFVRVWSGTRISLFVALTAVIIDICFGMIYGLVSGYFGGKVDTVMQRIQEVISSIPSLVILTLLLVIMQASLFTIILALMLTGWIGMARITRAQVLKIKEEEFVLASKTLGASNIFIIFKDILPNIFGQLIIMSMFSIPNAIFYEAFLAFVGLGIPQPQASLGTLINDGFKTILITPYMVVIPVLVLAVLMLSFNLLADGLRDAFDPTMKEA